MRYKVTACLCKRQIVQTHNCVESVRIRSVSGLYFPVFSPNAGKYGTDKLQARTLFT